jgi:hypothetical protein
MERFRWMGLSSSWTFAVQSRQVIRLPFDPGRRCHPASLQIQTVVILRDASGPRGLRAARGGNGWGIENVTPQDLAQILSSGEFIEGITSTGPALRISKRRTRRAIDALV